MIPGVLVPTPAGERADSDYSDDVDILPDAKRKALLARTKLETAYKMITRVQCPRCIASSSYICQCQLYEGIS